MLQPPRWRQSRGLCRRFSTRLEPRLVWTSTSQCRAPRAATFSTPVLSEILWNARYTVQMRSCGQPVVIQVQLLWILCSHILNRHSCKSRFWKTSAVLVCNYQCLLEFCHATCCESWCKCDLKNFGQGVSGKAGGQLSFHKSLKRERTGTPGRLRDGGIEIYIFYMRF